MFSRPPSYVFCANFLSCGINTKHIDMRHWTKTLFAALVLPLAAACGGGDKVALDEDVELRTGRYEGLLPAADCPGIEIVLDLMAGDSFEVEMRYIDRDTFTVRGGYHLSGDVLSAIDGESGDTTYFKVAGDSLRMLDSNKSYITSPFSDMYVLRRK